MRVDDILNNFLQENCFDCHAVYDVEADSYYSIYEEEIVLGGQPDAVADKVFMKYVKELGLMGEWNINTLTFMHELSHHLTLHLLDEEEVKISQEIKFFCSLESERFGDNEDICMIYFKCPEEAIATEYAVEYLNNNYELMQEFDKELTDALNCR